MSRVDLDKNRSALQQAFKEVTDPKNPTDWVLYSYDGPSSVLKVVAKGDGGIEEMVDDLNSGKVMYAYCQVKDPNTDLPKLVCINWQGEGVPENKKGVYANHITDVSRMFRGVHVTISARTEDDIDEDDIRKKVAKSSGANYSIHKEKPQPNANKPSGPVGSVYVKTRPHQEIKSDVRQKFWEQQQAEEKQRLELGRQKSIEEKQKLDKETKERELKETQEREQRERARLQKIVEIKQAEKRANAKNSEEEQKRWEQTQLDSRKDEEERASRANQLRKARASEAQSLVSGRQANPRNVFDQTPKSQFDDQERAAPPSRKLKHDFLEQKAEDTGRKQPITLPSEDPGNAVSRLPAASQPVAPAPAPAPAPAAPAPAPAAAAPPPAAPASQPQTRNLLAAGLPPRQDSDEEQEEQDWDALKPSEPEPSTEDFSYRAAAEPEPQDLYDDVQAPSQEQYQHEPADTYDDVRHEEPPQDIYDDVTAPQQEPPEELYDDVSAMPTAGQGAGQNYDPELGLVARALYDYQAMEENEITFDPDDLITNIDQVDPGWWVGVAPDGRQGMFPSNYVELLNG